MTAASRRALLGWGFGALGAGSLAAATRLTSSAPAEPAHSSYAVPAADQVVPFHGEHQSGITTPAQDRLHFAAFDLTTSNRADLVALLTAWTAAAEAMTAGRAVGGAPTAYDAPPADTGETHGLPAAHLTVTFGFGPSLFRDAAGADRFGLADRQPRELQRLPHFPADALDAARSEGDLCVQACADDPLVAVHAIRNLTRIAMGVASLRWSQLGYGRTSST